LPGEGSVAAAVSGDGSVVVGYASGRPFIWDATNGMRDLSQVLTSLGVDLTGWTLTSPTDISADGSTIVGSGTNPSGQQEAWLAFIPEPSTAWLVALGIGGLAARRGRGC